MGEATLFARTGGAPSLAVGMASIFSSAFGKSLLAVWYHFAIMFEALFILTTVDAGTRVARFMLQDLFGNVLPAMGRTSWYPSVLLCSGLVVAGWGYFLYFGVDRSARRHQQPVAAVRHRQSDARGDRALRRDRRSSSSRGKARFAWVTAAPLAWLVVVTSARGLAEAVQPGREARLPRARERPCRAARLGRARGRCRAPGAAPDLQRPPRRRTDAVLLDHGLGARRRDRAAFATRRIPASVARQPRRRRTCRAASSRTGSVTELLRRCWQTLRELSGDDAYDRYLAHRRARHASEAPPLESCGLLPRRAATQVERCEPLLLRP